MVKKGNYFQAQPNIQLRNIRGAHEYSPSTYLNRYQNDPLQPDNFFGDYTPEYIVESKRRRRQDEESSRLISSSAFSRLSETLGIFI